MKKKELEDILLKGNLNLLPATYLDGKESRILTRIASLMRHWPDEELYPFLLLSLLRLPRQFKKIRKGGHISRLISAEYFYRKKVVKAVDQYPQKRHLFVKLLPTRLEFPFGSKPVLGVIITFNMMKLREAFEEQHILEAARSILKGVEVVGGSFVDYQDKQSQVHVVYLELESEGQSQFSLDEIALFQKRLPDELKGCIQPLVPVTFMRRNEEEVYRNILTLRDQLKTVRDLPQATITFEEQTHFDLFFTVVLLRLVKEKIEGVLPLLERQFPKIVFIPDRIDSVGVLRKGHFKEATVFRVQLNKESFFRKDRSVDLYRARRAVVKMLTETLGPVRDYNGGLILKQNERLEDFMALASKEHDPFLLENFFYSITPIAMQSILPPTVVMEWFLTFAALLQKRAETQSVYEMSCVGDEETQVTIISSEDSSFKDLLLKEIGKYAIPSLELAYAKVNHHGTFCMGILFRPSMINNQIDLCSVVKGVMENWSQQTHETQILRIAVHGNEPSLDPRIAKGDQSYIILKMLFEGLTRIGPDGKPSLAIAESYEVSPDFKTYTFYLRESKWSNGAPITAHDFEYSWKKGLHPQAGSIDSQTFSLIKNARKAKANQVSLNEVGVKAIDEKTLLVELEYPVEHFLEVVAHWTYSLINRVIDQKFPGWAMQAGENYVSNGPFKLAEWKQGRAITVEKNPHYWDAEHVHLKKIIINTLQRGQSHMGMLTGDEVDIVGRPMTTFPIDGLDYHPEGVEQVSYPLNGVFILCFNTSQFPFNHKKIRQAFAHVVDREGIKSFLTVECAGPSYTLLPSKLTLQTKPLFPNKRIEEAKALFREGLGEIGFVKSDFPKLTLSYYSGLKRGELLKELAGQWKEAFDIDIHLENNEWDTHFNRLIKGKYQMGGIELNAKWNDPLHLLEFFEEQSDLLNISFWEHPQFQTLLCKAKHAVEPEERRRFLKEAESFLAIEMPAIPLFQISGNYLKRKALKGVFPSDCFQIDFKWSYKDYK